MKDMISYAEIDKLWLQLLDQLIQCGNVTGHIDYTVNKVHKVSCLASCPPLDAIFKQPRRQGTFSRGGATGLFRKNSIFFTFRTVTNNLMFFK